MRKTKAKREREPTLLSPRPAAEAAMVLPGAATLDEGLLEHAVSEINRIYVSKGLETARAIGNYVVESFFGGDLGAFREREKKHVTFRALADREDLHVAYNTIWYSVAVLEQLRLLPDNIAEALPLTHHKLLLPVGEVETKVELAKRAVEERLSSRDFAAVVKATRDAKGRKTRGGRRPLPAFAKGISRLRRIVDLATSEDVSSSSFERYSTDDARRLAEDLDQQVARLLKLKEDLLAAAGERDGSADKGRPD